MKTCLFKSGFTWLAICFSVLFFWGGCATTLIDQNQPPLILPGLDQYKAKFTSSGELINLKVLLRMPNEPGPTILSGLYKGHPVAATNLNLDEYCLRIARAVFTEVITQNITEDKNAQSFNAILSYKVIRSQTSTTGAFAWDDVLITLKVEWQLYDSKGELMWLDTVDAKAIKPQGNPFTSPTSRERFIQRAEALADDFAQKSYLSLSTAMAIIPFGNTTESVGSISIIARNTVNNTANKPIESTQIIDSKSEILQQELSVEFPKMLIGDEWRIDTLRGVVVRKVIKVESNGAFILEEKSEDNNNIFHLHYDSSYRLISRVNQETGIYSKTSKPPLNYLNFPLFVGKTWQGEVYTWATDGKYYNYKNVYSVEKVEMKRINSGNFKAFKLNLDSLNTDTNKKYKEIYWYSPDLKIIIKSEATWKKDTEVLAFTNGVAEANISSNAQIIAFPNEKFIREAIEKNDLDKLKELFERGADVNKIMEGGSTPLIEASKNGNSEIVKYLLDKGANINYISKSIYATTNTALIEATRNEHTETIKILLESGADKQFKDHLNKTAADYAVNSKKNEVKCIFGFLKNQIIRILSLIQGIKRLGLLLVPEKQQMDSLR